MREIADDGMRTALRDAARLFTVADERGHVVAATNERIENCGTDITRRARKKDPHRGRIS
jgi:hypothetical protein